MICCPLCAGTTAKEVERIPYSQIWLALADVWKARFTEEVINRHTPSTDTILLECQQCGLQFFAGAVPGDDEFYRELTTTSVAYYSEDRWDFQVAAKVILPNDKVLDIACGSGNFLQIIKAKGCDAVGIDTNPAAINMACANGLSAYCVALADFASSHAGCFDSVTAFQVIEHIAELELFIRSALTCLKPGGKLVLTVPNRQRSFRDAFEPLDCPPHHLTRWSVTQFTVLANIFGCRVIDLRFELASMHDCRALLRNKISRGGQSLWTRFIARVVFAPTLYSLYARWGLLNRWHLWRMSIMCVLEKPR